MFWGFKFIHIVKTLIWSRKANEEAFSSCLKFTVVWKQQTDQRTRAHDFKTNRCPSKCLMTCMYGMLAECTYSMHEYKHDNRSAEVNLNREFASYVYLNLIDYLYKIIPAGGLVVKSHRRKFTSKI